MPFPPTPTGLETESYDIITVMDCGVMQQPVGTMENEGETHNSVPNYEIITITFLQIRTIRSVFTACGDK